MSTHQFCLKSVHTFSGNEGLGFSANLYDGRKKVAEVLDDARGGPIQVHYLDKTVEKKLEAIVQSLPKVVCEGIPDPGNPGQPFSYQPDIEHFVNDLFVEHLKQKEEQKIARRCKTQTLYVLHSDGEDSYWAIKQPYGPDIKDRLKQKFGADLKEILNERFIETAADETEDGGPSPR
ncbi:MAG: hypothetical protein PHC98_05410 [Syntrophotalea acetylenica]|nr:hypothetical protein [Syntrophotalea acetylenica]